LTPLSHSPFAVVSAAGLTLATLPIATWRWAMVLRAQSVVVPLVPLLRVVCISTFVGQVSFGPTSADAVRTIYMWRLLRRAPGRIAVSVLADRALGLFSLLIVSAVTMVLRWGRVREVPQLKLLGVSLLVCLVMAFITGAVLFAAPSLLRMNLPRLQRYPQIQQLTTQIGDVLLAFRQRPAMLAAALCLSFVVHIFTITGLLLIAQSLQVGDVTIRDVLVAGPVAMAASILPFTPGGLGVGEAAFEQICRWLALAPALSAPYASIFFAFRAVSMVTLIPGAIAFVVHRHGIGQHRNRMPISRTSLAPPDPH
jgi:glycosyltransferase 2 family protein